MTVGSLVRIKDNYIGYIPGFYIVVSFFENKVILDRRCDMNNFTLKYLEICVYERDFEIGLVTEIS